MRYINLHLHYITLHFLLQAPQCPCSVRKRFSRDHCCRGRLKPGCQIVECSLVRYGANVTLSTEVWGVTVFWQQHLAHCTDHLLDPLHTYLYTRFQLSFKLLLRLGHCHCQSATGLPILFYVCLCFHVTISVCHHYNVTVWTVVQTVIATFNSYGRLACRSDPWMAFYSR